MSFPAPSEKQARLLWISVTALAVAVLLALLGVLVSAVGWVLNRLSPVLWPLAVAAILAYLLDPVVDFFQRRNVPRRRAILLVLLIGVALVLAVLATVVPQLVVETGQLIAGVPGFVEKLRVQVTEWLGKSPMGIKAHEAWRSEYGQSVQAWLTKTLVGVGTWVASRLGQVASWAGALIGVALVPIYTFYFLQEKEGIERKWMNYLPLRESKAKEEAVFVLTSINDYLISFFRGQVLVAMCVGSLLTVGYLVIGLDYALVLGVMAGVLGIVPYLGVMMSIVPAVTLAAVQFGDWLHPVLVLVLFGLVQALEGLVITPKIIGDRVGLHPLTIIIAVMVGTTLLGGILGGVLAIPLTAALRVLMFRYVWRRDQA